MLILQLEHLDRERFASFGDVIDTSGGDWRSINNGTTKRYDRLATVQIAGNAGPIGISIARGRAFHFPLSIAMLERHPLCSQSWIPRNNTPFVAIVAPSGKDGLPDEARLRAFYVVGAQGINYHLGTWHHPLMALGMDGDFVIVDLVGAAPNCDEHGLHEPRVIDGSFLK